MCLLWDFDHLIEFCLKALFSITHIYANPSEIEETLFAAEWLYGHTGCKQTQRDAAKLVCALGMKYSIGDGSDIRMKIYQEIERRPYVFRVFVLFCTISLCNVVKIS